MSNNNLVCIECGNIREKGKKTCRKCYLEIKRNYAKRRYLEGFRTFYPKVCAACKKEWKAWRNTSVLCGDCYRESIITGYNHNTYAKQKKTSKDYHRVLAAELLGRKLSYNEVCHHVDENCQNNNIDNLWVMSRHQHGRLHKYIRYYRVIWEKSQNENSVNCWDNLRIVHTTAWLEMTGAKVIKLNELVNQQPSALNGEGSETKHGTPNEKEFYGDDIVQTAKEY